MGHTRKPLAWLEDERPPADPLPWAWEDVQRPVMTFVSHSARILMAQVKALYKALLRGRNADSGKLSHSQSAIFLIFVLIHLHRRMKSKIFKIGFRESQMAQL